MSHFQAKMHQIRSGPRWWSLQCSLGHTLFLGFREGSGGREGKAEEDGDVGRRVSFIGFGGWTACPLYNGHGRIRNEKILLRRISRLRPMRGFDHITTKALWFRQKTLYLHVSYCLHLGLYVRYIHKIYISQSKIHIIILMKLLSWNNLSITAMYALLINAHVLIHKCIKFFRKPRP